MRSLTLIARNPTRLLSARHRRKGEGQQERGDCSIREGSLACVVVYHYSFESLNKLNAVVLSFLLSLVFASHCWVGSFALFYSKLAILNLSPGSHRGHR